ncbi:MAG: proline--tRNA ligase [Methanoregulaceae archaeon]|nr:proline--tRNA ligase [Methanoregulaceae archaeon]
MSKQGITSRDESFSDWYNDLVKRAELAENSPVRGSMVIRPNGYAIWELMQRALDDMFKATGHVNAYFPLLIPMSFFAREAEHVEGFAKESAIVTHHRLAQTKDGLGVDPDAKLEEPYVIRPSSETIIWHTYKNWIQSYRDLPILINQWANVMRWELRPRLFLRTTEFLWQEGHTAHATFEDAEHEALTILNECYARFAEEWMAVPVLKGVKSKNETFAGADHTYTIEALVQDKRAIQAGTSHHLGQNFAKAFDVTFTNKEGKLEHVFATSWGVSTRLIGTLIMMHSDDKGLVVPPRLAPIQVVFLPMGRDEDIRKLTYAKSDELATLMRGHGVRVKVDKRDQLSPGFKFNDWELKGACIRVEIGPRDLEGGTCVVARRDVGEKVTVAFDQLADYIHAQLDAMQHDLYARALAFREANTFRVDTWEEFEACFAGEGGGGFVVAHWDGTDETEAIIAEKTKATIRAIPMTPLHPDDVKPGKCVLTGRPSTQRVVFAKAY